MKRKKAYVCGKKGEKEMEIIVVIVFAILAIKETRKERKNPGYKSWMGSNEHSWDWWRGRRGL